MLDPGLLDDAAVIPGPEDHRRRPTLRRPSQRPPWPAGRRQDEGGPFPRLGPSSAGSEIDVTVADPDHLQLPPAVLDPVEITDPVLLDDAAVIPG